MMCEPQDLSPVRSSLSEVKVDMSSMAIPLGRVKAPPVCIDETLKKEAMTADELSKHCFPFKTPKAKDLFNGAALVEPSTVSSSSSTSSRDSSFSDCEPNIKHATPLRLEKREQSEQINLKVTARKISRNGRQSQRWFTEPTSQKLFRLTTGCVPIVEGGKILFASASRKPEWILPKGGWEIDEEMEESAIRESFEEAGVIGILGPRLSVIEYETRKGKKRRLALEELQKKAKLQRASYSHSPTFHDEKDGDHLVTEESASEAEASEKVHVDVSSLSEDPSSPHAHVSDEAFNRIRGQGGVAQSDETSSIASDASQTYSHVRMYLFPLYVSEVKKEWPESGRFRKVVEIDEAIRMCESRPELRRALIEVKEKKLHLPPEGTFAESSQEKSDE
jgi:ADP-ribose pyrophosphatase YjhB (NUDIX family)